MNEDMKYIAEEKDNDLTIRDLLQRRLNLSSRLLRKLKNSQGVYKNDEPVFLNIKVKKGDCIHVIFPDETSYFEPENIPIDAVYDDDDLLIINKQPYVVVHPTKSHINGTIANGLVHYMNLRQESYKIRFVNRLDRDTSGLLIIGKNSFIQEEISQQMREDLVIKKYIAIVEGCIEKNEDMIQKPIKKNPGERARVVSEEGQDSITFYKVLKRLGTDYTVVEILLKTGRTHQIRVHMSNLGYPVVGDELYGKDNKSSIKRQALHAAYLSFIHPKTGKRLELEAELPEDMRELINQYLEG